MLINWSFSLVFIHTDRYLLSPVLSRVSTHSCLPMYMCRSTRCIVMTSLQTELAKEGIPLPFGSRFWASNWPTGKAPLPGLMINLILSASVFLIICIKHATRTVSVGHRDSWATHERRVSVHLGCARIPYSDYPLLHCHRMSPSLASNSFFMC